MRREALNVVNCHLDNAISEIRMAVKEANYQLKHWNVLWSSRRTVLACAKKGTIMRKEIPALYEIAKRITLMAGMSYTDPRTLKTTESKPKRRKKPA
jgi:hypothetical protein